MATPPVARAGLLTDGRFGTQVIETDHQVRAAVWGVLAETEVTLSLHSRSGAPEEAILTFSTPRGARITGLWVRLRGHWVAATRMDAAAVRRTIADTTGLKARPDPAWLEQTGPDRYRLRVYPVPSRGQISVRYRYLHTLALRWGVRLYVYPRREAAHVGPWRRGRTRRRAPARVTVVDHGLLRPGLRRHVIRVPAHLALERPLVDPPISPRQPLRATLFFGAPTAHGAPGAALLVLQGNPAASARRWGTDVVFLVDGSRSVGEALTKQVPALLREMLATLGRQSRAGVVRFARQAHRLTSRLEPAGSRAVRRAIASLARRPARNGSSLRAGLTAAAGLLGRGRTARRRLVVVLTDGLLPSREWERGLWPRLPRGTELIFLVGRPGSGAGKRLRGGPLARLAERHAGLAFSFDPELHGALTRADQLASQRAAVRLAKALVRPGRISDLHVSVAGVRVPLGRSDLTLVGGLVRWVPLATATRPFARITFSYWGRRVRLRLQPRPMPRSWRAGLAALLHPAASLGVDPHHSLIVVDPADAFGRDRLRFAQRWGDRFFSRLAPPGSLTLRVGPFRREATPALPAPAQGRASTAPGRITRAMVQRLLGRHFLPAATRCYQATGPRFRPGQAVLRLELTRGEVVDAWLTHDTLHNVRLRRCLLAAVDRLRVPLSWADETLYRVSYPMRFRPADRSVAELRGWRPPPPPRSLNPLRGLR